MCRQSSSFIRAKAISSSTQRTKPTEWIRPLRGSTNTCGNFFAFPRYSSCPGCSFLLHSTTTVYFEPGRNIMRRTRKVVFASAMCAAAASIVTMQAGSDKSVTAAQVNGTWQSKHGEFKIWVLGQQRLQVEFSGVYEYKTQQGPTANT